MSNILDIKIDKWTKAAENIITSEYKKLGEVYSNAFDSIIYNLEKSSVPVHIQEDINKLKKFLDGCVDSDFVDYVRDFCSYEKWLIADYSYFRNRLNETGFWKKLESLGYVSYYKQKELEEKRKAEEAAAERRRQEELKRREEERRRAEAAAEERRRQEERRRAEERIRLEELNRKARERERKIKNIFKGIAGAAAVVAMLFLIVPNVKNSIQFNDLIEQAEMAKERNDYNQALSCLYQAQTLKLNDKRSNLLGEKFKEVKDGKESLISSLKTDINTILNTFSKVSFKYGKPENDLTKTQELIDQLSALVPEDAECAKFQKQLDYHKKRTR